MSKIIKFPKKKKPVLPIEILDMEEVFEFIPGGSYGTF